MGRASADLITAAAPYVAVRITDLRDIDIANHRFDFDLTFAALLMHSDGTVYHRYGGREEGDAERYLSLSTLTQLLRDTMDEHRAYDRDPDPPKRAEPLRAIDLPVLRQKVAAGQRIDCVHCHTVHDAEARDAMLRQTWRREDAYVYPGPARIGIDLDPESQSTVIAVQPGSAADRAGIEPGDTLQALGVQRSVRTFADVQWALHQAPFAANELSVRYRRADTIHDATLLLANGWKRAPAAEYAWRPLKWNLSPAPGFGGTTLSAAQRRDADLGDLPFAMRVTYFIDWGEQTARGAAARASGLRKGDLVVGFAGKNDFESFDHLHAFCALTLTAGDETEIEVWRDGKATTLRYPVPQ